MEALTIKFVEEKNQKETGDIHRTTFTMPVTIEEVRNTAKRLFHAGEVKLRYIDDENDKVCIVLQYELDTAIALAKEKGTLRLQVEVLTNAQDAKPEGEKEPAPAAAAAAAAAADAKKEEPAEALGEQLAETVHAAVNTLIQDVAGITAEIHVELPPAVQADEDWNLVPCSAAGVYANVALRLPKSIVHCRVQCDGCGACPIRGMRFKCHNCPNYDLCQDCITKARTIHDPDHVFLPLVTRLPPMFFMRQHRRRQGCHCHPRQPHPQPQPEPKKEEPKKEEPKKEEPKEDETKYLNLTPRERELVQELVDMGFTDIEMNVTYLRRYNGQISDHMIGCLLDDVEAREGAN